eukprot:s9174_g1.t1
MASRVAAQDLMKFCDDNQKNCGIWYTIAETTSQFTFANSESTKCQQKLIICMYDREYAIQSTDRLMWNVRFDKHKKSSFLTYFSHYEYGFHEKTLGSSSPEEEPKVFAFAMDDEWVIDEASMELIRVGPAPKEIYDKYDRIVKG